MALIQQRITIIRMRRPETPSLNEELQWFGSSLGLFNLRDKDKSCFRIFIELLKATKTNNNKNKTSGQKSRRPPPNNPSIQLFKKLLKTYLFF